MRGSPFDGPSVPSGPAGRSLWRHPGRSGRSGHSGRGLLGMLALAVALGLLPGRPAAAASGERLTVWFEADFDAQGRLESLRPQQEDEHPSAFWDALRVRLAEARIEPQLLHGRPARLSTGLAVLLEVNRETGAGAVRIRGMRLGPLVLRQAFAGYPRDIARTPGWSGDFHAHCTVGVEGRCLEGSIEVSALPGIPDSVRRWARATLAMWEFRPQRLDGVAIESRYDFVGNLHTSEAMPRDFRDPRRL